jgi:hypothetical protein
MSVNEDDDYKFCEHSATRAYLPGSLRFEDAANAVYSFPKNYKQYSNTYLYTILTRPNHNSCSHRYLGWANRLATLFKRPTVVGSFNAIVMGS